MKRKLSLALILVLAMTMFTFNPAKVEAATDTYYMLSCSELYMAVGDSFKLNVEEMPEGIVAKKAITWKSSNSKIATVDKNGVVSAKSKGKAKLTATVTNGSKKEKLTCNVKININHHVKDYKLTITEKYFNKKYISGSKTAPDAYLSVSYPVFNIKGRPEATKKLNAAMLEDHKGAVDEAKRIIDIAKEDAEYGLDTTPYSYDSVERMEYHNGRILSMVRTTSSYAGGVHPNYWFNSRVFDLATGKEVKLKSIFKDLKALNKKIISAVKNQVNKDDIINPIDSLTLKDWSYKWYIENGSLVVLFSPYDITHYAAGAQIVEISLEDLYKNMTDYGLSFLFGTCGTEKVSLSTNPSTGYGWVVKADKKGILDYSKNSYVPDDKTGTLMGSGGTQTWKIKGLKKGLCTLTFEYKRAWENESIQKQIYTYYVDKNKNVHLVSCIKSK